MIRVGAVIVVELLLCYFCSWWLGGNGCSGSDYLGDSGGYGCSGVGINLSDRYGWTRPNLI
jgi:hypothetical protein